MMSASEIGVELRPRRRRALDASALALLLSACSAGPSSDTVASVPDEGPGVAAAASCVPAAGRPPAHRPRGVGDISGPSAPRADTAAAGDGEDADGDGVSADDGGVTTPALDASAVCDASLPPAFDCEAYIEIGQLLPTTCAVVDPVSRRVGHLQWICAGGAARLTLGSLELTGSVQGHALELATCREDPVSWLQGHYESIQISANLAAMSGSLSFARASGLSCPRVFTDCSAAARVTLIQ